MILNTIHTLIQQHFYVVSRDRLTRLVGSGGVERITAKHIDLKPELIILDNQPHGFKKISDDRISLDHFAIFLELEFAEDEFGDLGLVSLDLYSELPIHVTQRVMELSYLAKMYSGLVSLETLNRLNDTENDALVITSNISDFFITHSIEDDLRDGALTPSELEGHLESYFTAFIGVIEALDSLLLKGQSLNSMQQLFRSTG